MRNYYFGGRLEGLKASSRRFSRHEEALRFLLGEVQNATSITEIRSWASRRGYYARTERDLLNYAASGLISGDLILGNRDRLTFEDRVPILKKGASAIGDQQPAYRSSLKSSPPPGQASDLRVRKPQTPKPAAKPAPTPDVDKQVAALLAAAKNGAPFCEQCEKARAERAK